MPVRSAIIGAVLALMVVTTTFTFGASLNSLVSHPALYGWNWDYELGGQGGDLPSQIEPLLDQDHLVAEWSGVYFGELSVDGQLVPVMGGTPGAAVAPPVLSGHGLDAPDQVVLGAATLAELHKQVGSTVEVRGCERYPDTLADCGDGDHAGHRRHWWWRWHPPGDGERGARGLPTDPSR